MDPQQVLVLHVGYIILHESHRSCLRGAMLYFNIGVFVGVESSGLAHSKRTNVFSASGSALSISSGRLSYTLGLVGPCYSIDTACSSSLAALHLCNSAIREAETRNGVTIGTKFISEATSIGISIAGMTSFLGRCHTFDDRADGYCRGEGCGAFLLSWSEGRNTILGTAV